jgi:hypothetical protein
MRSRFPHATHVVRVAAVFLAGIILFLIARSALVPEDFGVLGFYRAGAIDDVRAKPIGHAGTAACVGCHVGKYESEFGDPEHPPADLVADNRHSVLPCEGCHGPLAFHAADQKLKEEKKDGGTGRPVPEVAGDKLCLGCHRQITGRPATQPQVIPVDHGAKDACISCHRPHRPRTDEDEE